MQWKEILTKLLRPPVWVMAVLAAVCTAALVFTFANGYEEYPLACLAYVPSFYTLSVIVLRCIRFAPKQYRAAKQRVYDHPVGNRFMTDPKFKTHVTLYCSLAVNLLYVALNAVSGFFYRSAWFVVLAFYYKGCQG